MTADTYQAFPGLSFDRPADGVLRITLDAPGLNAVSPSVHRELADVLYRGSGLSAMARRISRL